MDSDIAQQYMEIYHSILERHNKKQEDVKVCYENAVMKLSSDIKYKEQYTIQLQKLYREADENNSNNLVFGQF